MSLEIYSSGNQLFSAMRVSLWFLWITVEKYGEKNVENLILNAYKRQWSIQLQLWYKDAFHIRVWGASNLLRKPWSQMTTRGKTAYFLQLKNSIPGWILFFSKIWRHAINRKYQKMVNRKKYWDPFLASKFFWFESYWECMENLLEMKKCYQ